MITTIKKKKRKFEEITSADDESHKDTIVFPFVANTSSSLKKQKKKTKSDGVVNKNASRTTSRGHQILLQMVLFSQKAGTRKSKR